MHVRAAIFLSLALACKIIMVYILINRREELSLIIHYLRQLETTIAAPLATRTGLPGELATGLFRGLLLSGILTLLFYQLAEDVAFHEVQTLDTFITHLVRHHTSLPLTTVMKGFTFLGYPGTVTVITAAAVTALLLLRRPLLKPLFIALATTGSWLLDELLKWAFRRPRPAMDQLVHASGYSFPSGHATVSMALFGSIAYLAWTYLPPCRLRWLISGFFALLILSIGISRIYLGVHYPSDVLGGFMAGSIWLTLSVLALKITGRKRNTPAAS
ncbi:phosphatase PAP2 family protein [Desulfofundulus thermobenzoicus]|uniref:Phosphatase PAP2 family protein n=1 Tax=Desulfofundulus thermobenzoicus TaxID=29376 RepID=A0A6N7IP24_9FIRM|nr:phosphatase PAP2 family protein [Desulfofundulus thermobenzoicus]MQL51651.1 phosphatase PAP2 family protein [Desulfofundulus thermobenzoicus]